MKPLTPGWLCVSAFALMLTASGCLGVGPLTRRVIYSRPAELVAVVETHGTRMEVWHIEGKPFKKIYIKNGRKVKEEIFTADGKLYVVGILLADGTWVDKYFSPNGVLKGLTKERPGNPSWYFSESYHPDGTVNIPGKWRPLLTPEQIKAYGVPD